MQQIIETHDYTQSQISDPARELRELAPLVPDLRALGGENNMKIKHGHVKIRPTDKIVDSLCIFLTASRSVSPSQTTDAKFVQLCNPVGGVIIAFSDYDRRKDSDDGPYPALTNGPTSPISNTSFLPSEFPCGLLNIYIFRMRIIHEAVSSILEQFVNVHNDGKFRVWPRITFDISSDEGNAILGTVHGAGVAWLLIQRKTDFSRKRIVRITVVWAECEGTEYSWPSLLFCIG
jgi:hypothetical protein